MREYFAQSGRARKELPEWLGILVVGLGFFPAGVAARDLSDPRQHAHVEWDSRNYLVMEDIGRVESFQADGSSSITFGRDLVLHLVRDGKPDQVGPGAGLGSHVERIAYAGKYHLWIVWRENRCSEAVLLNLASKSIERRYMGVAFDFSPDYRHVAFSRPCFGQIADRFLEEVRVYPSVAAPVTDESWPCVVGQEPGPGRGCPQEVEGPGFGIGHGSRWLAPDLWVGLAREGMTRLGDPEDPETTIAHIALVEAVLTTSTASAEVPRVTVQTSRYDLPTSSPAVAGLERPDCLDALESLRQQLTRDALMTTTTRSAPRPLLGSPQIVNPGFGDAAPVPGDETWARVPKIRVVF